MHPFSSGPDGSMSYATDAVGAVAASPSDGYSSFVGIITAIVGNTLISFALNIQRYAHIKLNQEGNARQEKSRGQVNARRYGAIERDHAGFRTSDALQHHGRELQQPLLNNPAKSVDSDSDSTCSTSSTGIKHYLHSSWWWLGITLMIVGECGNFLAYGFAPASIVSPLGVVALVANCLIAPWMLQEHFRRRDGVGVVVAVAGCVTVVLSASGSDPKLDADQIWNLITTWEFETYLGTTIGLIVVLMTLGRQYADKSILVDLGLVGLFGGYTALSTKGVASLLSNTYWRVVTFPLTYLLVAVLVGTAIMQVHYINRALQSFNSTQVIPTQFVLFTISVIVGSAILYRDFESKTAQDAVKFVGGCLLTFFGVWCITAGRHETGDAGADFCSQEHEQPQSDLTDEDGYKTPNMEGGSANVTPIIRLTTHDDNGLPSSPLTSRSTAQAMNPTRLRSTDSAIHTDSAGEVVESSHRRTKPPMHATTSLPMIHPSYKQSQRSRSPARHADASPDMLSADSAKSPSQSPIFNALTRGMFTSILPSPGPLTSPLSSSLNTIVIDSLRRGVDSTGHSPRKSLRSVQSQNLSLSAGLGLGESVQVGEVAPRSAATSQTSGHFPTGARARSEGASTSPLSAYVNRRTVSSTIVDFLRRGNRRKDDEDEEAGSGPVTSFS